MMEIVRILSEIFHDVVQYSINNTGNILYRNDIFASVVNHEQYSSLHITADVRCPKL